MAQHQHPRPRGPQRGVYYAKVDRRRRRREKRLAERKPDRAERLACLPRYAGSGWPVWLIRSR